MTDYFSLGFPIITIILGVVIENRFRLFQRLNRLYAYLRNKMVKVNLIISVKSEKSPREIGNLIKAVWKKEDKIIRIIKDTEHFYSISNYDCILDITEIEEEEIIIKTSNLETPISEIDNKFNEIMNLLENIKCLHIERLSLSALLPYKFEFMELKTTSDIEVEDYDIYLRNDKWKSSFSLKLKSKKQEIIIDKKNISEMNNMLKKLFRPI